MLNNKNGLELRWEPESLLSSFFLSPLAIPHTCIPLMNLRWQGCSEEGPKLEHDYPITTSWLPQLFPLPSGHLNRDKTDCPVARTVGVGGGKS